MSAMLEYTDYPIEEFERKFGDHTLLTETSTEEVTESFPSIGMTWREMSGQVYPHAEKVIFGLSRGQVGMTVASTDIGKTTFALNIALTLASGRTFEPFVTEPTSGTRVMFIDGENVKPDLQADLNVMMQGWSLTEQDRVARNLFIICDEEIDQELLTLSNTLHLEAVIRRARDFSPDLIIIDTMAALFNLHDENSNALIKQVVMQPLRTLAKEANAAVWLQHHSGKRSESPAVTNPAYMGRGGSQFGSLARTVLTLIAPDMSLKERVILSVKKAKGYSLGDVAMRLDTDARWFRVRDEIPPAVQSSYTEVVKSVTSEMRTADIITAFDGFYACRTIEAILKEAVKRGDLKKVRQGCYAPVVSAISAEALEDCGNCGSDAAEAESNSG